MGVLETLSQVSVFPLFLFVVFLIISGALGFFCSFLAGNYYNAAHWHWAHVAYAQLLKPKLEIN